MSRHATQPAHAALALLVEGSSLEHRSEGDWAVLVDRESPARRSPGSIGSTEFTGPRRPLDCHALGAPGLWRLVPPGVRSCAGRVFELPPQASQPAKGDPAALVSWARAARRGGVPLGWAAPSTEDLATWAPPERRRVRVGPRVAHAELVHPGAAEGRLALVFPELVRLPAALPGAREAWLETLLDAVTQRWRFVRVGTTEVPGSTGTETRAVRAEVDLTGVPEPWAELLVQLSLEALRGAVEWALASLAFLADPDAPSRALHGHPQPTELT